MRLLYDNEYFDIENNINAINTIFEKINESLEQKDIIFSHLIIDNIDVYENHEQYIKENIQEILEIKVVTRNIKEMIWETIESIHSYLQRAIPALKELVENNYDNFSSKSWEGINQLAEGMQWIMQFADLASSSYQQPANWAEIQSSLQECESSFAPLLEAVELQDTILILDILSYEVTPAYQLLEKNLAKSLKDKEFLRHVN